MMKVKEGVEFRRLAVNERNFLKKLKKTCDEYGENIAFVCKSQTLHTISKKGNCRNSRRGFTAVDYGICMETTQGAMGLYKLNYNVFAFDLFPNLEGLEGVETEITTIFYGDIVKYKLPWKEMTIEKVFVLEYE